MEGFNQVNYGYHEVPDLNVFNFCPELKEYFLNTQLNCYDQSILTKLIREYNTEILEISYQVTVQIANGHLDTLEQYSEIMRALSQKKLEVNTRRIFVIPKPIPKKFFVARIVLYILSFILLCGSGYMGYSLFQEMYNSPNSVRTK